MKIMSFDFLDALGKVSDALEIFINVGNDLPPRGFDQSVNSKEKPKNRSLKISLLFFGLAIILFFIVYKTPVPPENFNLTMIITTLIGIIGSFLFFFLLILLELYYFKSVCRLMLFSVSSVLLGIAVSMAVYFRCIL